MNCKELLIFDIKSEYGHFRKYNTTTSPLTYSIPTRTAIAGILGAILGIERETRDGVYPKGAEPVQNSFSKEHAGIAVQIIGPVKKEFVAFNLINTKNSFYDLTKAKHTQIDFELLKNPHFRIYLTLYDKNRFEELTERIRNKRHHFTPYLGLAQFTAQIEWIGRANGIEITPEPEVFTEIVTTVNMSKLRGDPSVKFQPEAFYSVNNMPITMNAKREVTEFSEVLIEKNGKPLHVRVSKYLFIEEIGNILFL